MSFGDIWKLVKPIITSLTNVVNIKAIISVVTSVIDAIAKFL